MKRVATILLSMIYVVLLACVAAWLAGLLLGMVDGMRTIGTHYAASWFPYFDPARVSDQPFRNYPAGSFPGIVEDIINWNNMYFRGYTRFGSGLGCVIGAIYAATTYKFACANDRLPAIVLAGFVVGARSMLMIASAPISAIIGGVICALIAFFLGVMYVRDNRVPRLLILKYVL